MDYSDFTFNQNRPNGQNGQGFYQAFPPQGQPNLPQGQPNPPVEQVYNPNFSNEPLAPTYPILPDNGSTYGAADSTYGVGNRISQWHGVPASANGGASSCGDLASLYGRIDISTQPRAIAQPKRPRLIPSVTVPGSTAGLDVADDRYSIAATSEHGDALVERYAIDLGKGNYECRKCKKQKHPKCEMVTHTKPYRCTSADCSNRAFATKSDLERHAYTHADIGNLTVAYYCNQNNCRARGRAWPRWDNFKTHLRDVHKILNPLKEEYIRRNDEVQPNTLAGIGPDLGADHPMYASADDFENDILELGDASGQFAVPNGMGGVIDLTNVALSEHPQTANLIGLDPYNKYPTNVSYPQSSFPTAHRYGNNMPVSPGFSGSAVYAGSNAMFTSGMSQPTSSYQHTTHALMGMASPRPSVPTTESIQSTSNLGGFVPGYVHPSPSIASYALPSPRPRNQSQTTWKTVETHPTMPNITGSPGVIMDNAVDNHSVRSGASAAARRGYGSLGQIGMELDKTYAIAVDDGAQAAEPEAGEHIMGGVGHDAGDADLDGDGEEDVGGDHCASNTVAFTGPPSSILQEPAASVENIDNGGGGDYDNDEEDIKLDEITPSAAQLGQHPGPAPSSDVNEIVQKIEQISGEQLDSVLVAIRGMPAFHKSGYQLQTAAQPAASASSGTPAQIGAQTGASESGGSKKYRCTFEGCQSSFDSHSTWKKHDTRHRRPFGCTYGCQVNNKAQTFGSKNDWKRHEEPSHFSADLASMTWKCDEKHAIGAVGAVCAQIFYSRNALTDHLAVEHSTSMVNLTNRAKADRVARCRQIPVHEATFWCGFCVAVVNTAAGPAYAANASLPFSQYLSTRFNHIDNHFMGRGFPRKSIEEWREPQPPSPPPPPRPAPASVYTHRDGEDRRRSSHMVRACQTHGPVFTEGCPTCKKPKRAMRTEYWSCCTCLDMYSTSEDRCGNCNHRQCGECNFL